MSDVLLRAEGVHRSFGDEVVLDGIDLVVRTGEVVALLGPSGCGKTTLFNIIAGFDQDAEYRTLTFKGRPVTGPQQELGVVFQEGSLFPWFTLRQNLLFGEAVNRDPHRDRLVTGYLRHFGLLDSANKYPDQLSGGQQQRAALARALINQPRLLLADEPFRALDSQTRLRLQSFLWWEIKEDEQTLCFITHDVDEALFLADRIVVLSSKPTTALAEFDVRLPGDRTAETVISPAFVQEKRRFVRFSEDRGLDLLPTERPASDGLDTHDSN